MRRTDDAADDPRPVQFVPKLCLARAHSSSFQRSSRSISQIAQLQRFLEFGARTGAVARAQDF